MKKNLFRILVVALAAASMASFTMLGVSADNTVIKDGTWVTTDRTTTNTAVKTLQTITVEGVNDSSSDLTVTAYQVVKGTYKDGKLTGYVLCNIGSENNIADIEKPSATEITRIATAIGNDSTSLQGIELSGNNGTYTAQVEAGLYIVLVTKSDTVVYNPAVVAVNVTDANLTTDSNSTGGSVNMLTDFFEYPSTAYLKSSSSGFNKDIVGSSKNTEGDTVAYGDTVNFKIHEMTIPSYSDDYKGLVTYKITDTLESGSFQGVDDLKVKVGGTDAPAGSYTVTYKTGASSASSSTTADNFEIAFTNDYIRSIASKSNADRAVEITYSSTVTNSAGLNYAENKNTATLQYSNDPKDSTKFKELTDTTYHYTFGIDASIDSESTNGGDEETHELNKVTKAKAADEDYESATADKSTRSTKKSKEALEGAEFALYSDAGFTTVVGEATSDKNGHISFVGLDEGTYYLKETAAPEGYYLNDKDYQITIEATLNEEGALTKYTITTKSKDADGAYNVSEGSATYTSTPTVAADGSITNDITKNVTPAEVVNTTIAELPSTGGAGTIALTIGAALGMGAFLTVYIVNKKKENSAE